MTIAIPPKTLAIYDPKTNSIIKFKLVKQTSTSFIYESPNSKYRIFIRRA